MSASGSLHQIMFPADRAKLVAFASARGTIPPSGDLGYAVHQALTAAFGSFAPKPFQFLDDGSWRIVGYSTLDARALQEAALGQREAAPAFKLASQALGWSSMTSRPMPRSWSCGQSIRFSVRARPVCRINRHRERGLPRECDIFLRAVASKNGEEGWLRRDEVYVSWCRQQFSTAATILTVRLSRFKRTEVYRKGAPRLDGPDAIFSGILTPIEPAAFLQLLQRGVGRHRAFGFGMLRLEMG